ncbi:transcription factor IIA, alpha/beta subunit [Boeremia exigua]|uniref:transcription factor IIA, alpha/beta subunit n=1 Tax=Boeremia exigua TaxID=749465 RepID=UPI001E8CC428|nr:transcription factor IIA, alpha/beta subunit [Boeremia exigua]KAH6643198.1 transcription factor IIA, alpha/beta subunit [Boeremia exigua]
MSNQVVGNVYQQIIEKVIQASQNDFEEFGVDQSTLDEMKQGWQEKLSALKVAQFPWDPQPEPVRQPPTVPSNVKVDHDLPQVSAAPEHVNFPNAQIKTETPYQPHPPSNYPQAQAYPGGGYDQNHGLAQQRAHNLVMQRQQQNNMMPQQSNFPNLPQQNLHLPPQGQHMSQQQRMMAPQQQQMQRPPQQQLPQQRPPQQQQQQQQQQQNNGNLYNSQTDGAGEGLEDWKAFLAARRAAETEEGRTAADEFMRARVDAMAMQQDSGLMVPLDSLPKGKKRRAAVKVLQAKQAEASSSTAPSASVPGMFDGPDDDIKPGEEDPDDAINSDLDDPEDDLNDGDNSDDDMVDYMLCTYDKVQRVKNKWKCTLKDGILTTNKKEYLFHKANGEFEW